MATLAGNIRGPQGAKGDQGDQGDTGPPGPPNSLSVSSTATGAPGSNASVSVSGTAPTQALTFTIPRGDVGQAGPPGEQGQTGPPGEQGPAGTGLNLRGSVEHESDLAGVQNPQVGDGYLVNDTGELHVWDGTHWINVGGIVGPQGVPGDPGAPGPPGSPGPANTLTVTGTTTGDPGTSASVSISGASPNQQLAFTIPRGEIGQAGSPGATGPRGTGWFTGNGSPVEPVAGAIPGDLYLNLLNGDVYTLTGP